MDEVVRALGESGVAGVTVVETTGFGRQKGHSDLYKGTEQSFGLVPKRMLIVYVNDDDLDQVIKCICNVARTEKVGDGKIAVCDIDNMVRIRTGEQGETAT
jgi:nitrogen regulatory protein PII